ncbi:VWA domain-containing protein [Silvibacterium acidisoli]|uniref:VWA domain-containing protein n=1 Tax=Acidobacteriaceae bacterium ZG23-2 TaxID=2883246 RepID=UPI00406C35D3
MVHRVGGALSALLVAGCISGWAQNQSAEPAPDGQPGQYTLRTESRVVLNDVMVTDSQGNPVRGLPGTSFRVYDNGKLQKVNSFEEHTPQPGEKYEPAAQSGAPGTFSNANLKHLPPVVNVVVIDIANLDIVDQMFLYAQLKKFFEQAPLDQPIAIYLRAAAGCFPVQDFTADREVLLAALRRTIPRVPPTGKEWLNDLDTMHRLALLLGPVQGRKNVLWFSGGSTLFLNAAKSMNSPDVTENLQLMGNDSNWRQLYDELEQERIALYPVDARGLMVEVDPSIRRQHELMNEMAQATGGQAIVNTNALQEAAARLMDTDRSYYTLSYTPQNFKEDNKYHRIRIELDNGSHYQLSYRQGYYADGSKGGSVDVNAVPGSRTRLLSDGQKLTLPGLGQEPITFQARLLDASSPELAQRKATSTLQAEPPRKNSKSYVVRYSVPASGLSLVPDGEKQKLSIDVASIKLSDTGNLTGKHAEEVALTLGGDASARIKGKSILIDQPVNLRGEDKYLYLAVWDPVNGRTGTMQVPVDIPR